MTATIEARGLTKHFGKTAALDGLDLIEPGVVQPHRWRPGPGDMWPDQEVTAWCGVARKS